MKPTIIRNSMIYQAPHHFKSKQLGSMLSKELQEKYHKHSARVVEGDNVKVMRGEFKGIEGKVTQVSSEKNGVAIEGIKREKLKGGNVDLYIHTSNLMITNLNLEDKWRQNRLEGQKTKTVKEKPVESQKEISKPKEIIETKAKSNEIKEKSKQIKERPKTTKSKEKITKSEKLPEKKGKQTKTAKSVKKETN
ncbi:MAG TPA: 50S ribosomal protein L24 [Nitrosopumilaceae archaeon]|nr:50S ribosomal protein L24 [Nitrosopumilaceae archaeon]